MATNRAAQVAEEDNAQLRMTRADKHARRQELDAEVSRRFHMFNAAEDAWIAAKVNKRRVQRDARIRAEEARRAAEVARAAEQRVREADIQAAAAARAQEDENDNNIRSTSSLAPPALDSGSLARLRPGTRGWAYKQQQNTT